MGSDPNDIDDAIDVLNGLLTAKKAEAATARDTMLSGLSGDDKEKATLLADAIIVGADITEVTLTQDAVSAVIACDDVYASMGVEETLGFCQASLASGRRRLLADYTVSILLSTAQIDQSTIDASVAKLTGATVSKVEDPRAVLSNIPGVDADSDEFTDFYTKAKDSVQLAEDIKKLEDKRDAGSGSSDDGTTELILFITIPLVTFMICCVLLYYRKKVAELCGRACCFWRRGGGRPSGSSARASQYTSRTPEMTSGVTGDEPAPTPDSARWASSRPAAADPWTEPQSLSPFGAAPAAIFQQPFEKRTDVAQLDATSVSSDDSISSDDSDPFGATPAATPAAAFDPAFSDLSDDSDDDSDDDPFGEAPAQQQPIGGAQSSQQDMDMGETLSFGDTSDGEDGASGDPFGSNDGASGDPFGSNDGASDDPFGSNDGALDDPFGSVNSGGDDPFADPFEDANSP